MKPSNFLSHPYDSILQHSEDETIARNIMVILKREGDKFKKLSWETYKQHRLKDGNFSNEEKASFDRVVGYCSSEEQALAFCKNWANLQ